MLKTEYSTQNHNCRILLLHTIIHKKGRDPRLLLAGHELVCCSACRPSLPPPLAARSGWAVRWRPPAGGAAAWRLSGTGYCRRLAARCPAQAPSRKVNISRNDSPANIKFSSYGHNTPTPHIKKDWAEYKNYLSLSPSFILKD